MHRLVMLVLFALMLAGTATAQTSDLLISEYVEGSNSNKAVEIYNGTEDVIDLGGYAIVRYSNGTTSGISTPLDAVDLGPGEAYVIADPSADATLLAMADQTSTNINFNGNDALVLTFGGSTVIDSFGRVGEDPGSYWSCVDGTTQNHTLRRLSSICSGDVIVDDLFDPCVEWSFFPMDVFSGLGEHIADCGTVAEEASSWGAIKAQFR